MANIILQQEFNKFFTAKVNEHLENGYEFNLNSMGGSNGNQHVDMTNGTKVRRIQLERFSNYSDDDYTQGLKLVVYEREAFKNTELFAHNNLWESDCEEVEVTVWYKVNGRNNYDGSVYTEDKEFAKECTEKHYNRRRAIGHRWTANEKEITLRTEEEKDFVRDMCRTHKGYASIGKRHIDKLVKEIYEDRTTYKVMYRVYFKQDKCNKSSLVIKKQEFGK